MKRLGYREAFPKVLPPVRLAGRQGKVKSEKKYVSCKLTPVRMGMIGFRRLSKEYI